MAKPLAHEKRVADAASKAGVAVTKDNAGRTSGSQPGSDLVKWIEQSLTIETHLSGNMPRLSEYMSQQEIGIEDESSGNGTPLREDDLLRAIADLDSSTDALKRQTQVLEAQEKLVESRNVKFQAKRSLQVFADETKQRNWTEDQKIKATIFESQNEVKGLLHLTKEFIEKASGNLRSTMNELANRHDSILDNVMENPPVGVGASTEQVTLSTLDTVERKAALLSRLLAEEVQVRLDRTYLKSLQNPSSNVDSNHERDNDEALALEQDFRSLYTDIPDVATMYVAHKYKYPLIRAVQGEQSQRKALAALHSSNVMGQLSNMTDDLLQLKERLQAFHSFRCVVRHLQDGYSHFKMSSKSDVFPPVIAASKPPRELGPAMKAMLRHFGISAEASSRLQQLVNDKTTRLQDDERMLRPRIDVEARKAIDIRKTLVQSLLHETEQEDAESLARLDALEAGVTFLREQVEAVTGQNTSRAVQRQRDFTARWS